MRANKEKQCSASLRGKEKSQQEEVPMIASWWFGAFPIIAISQLGSCLSSKGLEVAKRTYEPSRS